MVIQRDPSEFIRLLKKEKWILLDVRSPKEFLHAHIPGAVNLALLNDDHRHEIGLTYKKSGREAAVLKGFELVGPHFAGFIQQVAELTSNKNLLVYCWRGGMRSGIMGWILGMAGYRIHLLSGGYKAYRNSVLSDLAARRNYLVLGGQTGSGKTEVLNHLSKLGEQVIDLEGLARHKGSAFGGLGQESQPHYEQFENNLAFELALMDANRVIWIENESNSIGSLKVPDSLFDLIRKAPAVEMVTDRLTRKQRILSEYGHFPKEELAGCTAKLRKRLGDLRTRESLAALDEGNRELWLEILLDYYDKTYAHGMSSRNPDSVYCMEMNTGESHESFATRLSIYARPLQHCVTP